jgi:hypothetical protein
MAAATPSRVRLPNQLQPGTMHDGAEARGAVCGRAGTGGDPARARARVSATENAEVQPLSLLFGARARAREPSSSASALAAGRSPGFASPRARRLDPLSAHARGRFLPPRERERARSRAPPSLRRRPRRSRLTRANPSTPPPPPPPLQTKKQTTVEDLLLWRDLPKSAACLGGATCLYLLLEWSGIPLMTWLSNAALALALATAVWGVAAGAAKL